MNAQRFYKTGTRVQLLRSANRGDEAVILERIAAGDISTGQYTSAQGGIGSTGTQRYRVQVIRTGQELLETEERLAPCGGTEYETE